MKHRVICLFVVLLALAVFAVSALAETIEVYNFENSLKYYVARTPEGYSRYSFYVNNSGELESFTQSEPVDHLSIPEGVVTIGENVFNRSEIKSISFPSSLRTIEDDAFVGVRMEKVTIPGTVKYIGHNAFACSQPSVKEQLNNDDYEVLKRVTIMNGVETLGNEVFANDWFLEKANIPASVKSIGELLFYECNRLSEVDLEEGLTVMGKGMFSSCYGLKEITIPSTVEKIADEAFVYCKGLENVVIKDGVKGIGRSAFSDCRALVRIEIPGSVKSIGMHAFDGCSSLEKVVINNGVKEIESGAFGVCQALTRIDIPESVKYIDGYAFYECNPGLVIHGKADSYAERYAEENNIEFDDGTIKPSSIKITNGKSAELQMTKTLKLKTQLKPANATTKLTWKSSKESVATVSDKGVVTAVGKGTATITVTTKNGKTATIKIKVVALKPTKVKITNGKKATLKVGEKLKLKTELTPLAAETKLTFKSSDKRIAAVSKNGEVTAKKAGTAKITVTTANGKKATITIKVKK